MSEYVASELTVSLGAIYCWVVVVVSSAESLPHEATEKTNAHTNSIAVIDSFKEGNIGAATGKLAGGLNNASAGVIDAELGNSIQHHINLLEFIKSEMSEVVGISKQREG